MGLSGQDILRIWSKNIYELDKKYDRASDIYTPYWPKPDPSQPAHGQYKKDQFWKKNKLEQS